ncbi:rhodanese-like domain-containing protein [Patulibacter sp. SYSU D01012]|uniref:rhodanese-like domain-containing protein n=1 Tax=Patulibacter sp. SYSU D01012 TaxID=2817381 RepID=UPI001B3081D1|nr:rhodanese-like domain-containing protein [Patulibacter sp. SYSU D01012]
MTAIPDPYRRAAAPTGHDPQRVPHVLASGLVALDPWWGTIQPQTLHPDLPTVGELEVIAHLRAGGAAVDTRRPEYVAASGTLPGARVVPWEEIAARADEIDPGAVTVLFCNGPQCAATPRAVRALLDAGRDPRSLAYYRGGLLDWMALGLPTAAAD